MKHLVLDFMNFAHRARSGFALGDHAVTFNFFRNLRALIERLEPNSVVVVLEGSGRARRELFPEYKANRKEKVDPDDPKSVKRAEELASFFRQTDDIIAIMKSSFPVTIVRNPHLEGDDMIYTVAAALIADGDDVTIVSSDTDFTQLVDSAGKITVYNPHEKAFFDKPDYDYVTWKALRGDATDNIPGIPGVGDVTAMKAVMNSAVLNEIISRGTNREIFERNVNLISLRLPTSEQALDTEITQPTPDWIEIIDAFAKRGFKSIVAHKSWEKFKSTFASLTVPLRTKFQVENCA